MSAKLAFRRQHTGDRTLDEVQRLAQQAAQKLNALPFASGVFVRQQTITAGGTTVTHNLGRIPAGYLVTRLYSGSTLGATFSENATPMTTTTATFAAGPVGTVVADLYFF